MAEKMTEMRVERTMAIGAEARRGRERGRRNGMYGLVAAVLIAVVVGGVALHDRGASHPAAPAIPRVTTRAETQFLANNATNPPSAVTTNVGPDVNRAETRFLENNTTNLPNAVDIVTTSPNSPSVRYLEQHDNLPNAVMVETRPAISSSQQRSLDVNTTWLPAAAAVNTSPLIMPSGERWFIDVNTNLGMVESPVAAPYPYGEAVTPTHGPR